MLASKSESEARPSAGKVKGEGAEAKAASKGRGESTDAKAEERGGAEGACKARGERDPKAALDQLRVHGAEPAGAGRGKGEGRELFLGKVVSRAQHHRKGEPNKGYGERKEPNRGKGEPKKGRGDSKEPNTGKGESRDSSKGKSEPNKGKVGCGEPNKRKIESRDPNKGKREGREPSKGQGEARESGKAKEEGVDALCDDPAELALESLPGWRLEYDAEGRPIFTSPDGASTFLSAAKARRWYADQLAAAKQLFNRKPVSAARAASDRFPHVGMCSME